jgi:thymidylate synthase
MIKAKNPSIAWLKATKYILERGARQGELEREVIDLFVEIEHPLEITEEIDKAYRQYIGAKWIKIGSDSIFPENFEDFHGLPWFKSYWTRLRKFRESTDQLHFIIKRLQSKPKSNQLFCTTFDPCLDIQPHRPFNPTMPCLVALDFKYRNGNLGVFALFRSHDFGRKAYGNYLGLGKLLKYVSSEAGYEMGHVLCYSRSAHIRRKEYPMVRKIVSIVKQQNPSLFLE